MLPYKEANPNFNLSFLENRDTNQTKFSYKVYLNENVCQPKSCLKTFKQVVARTNEVY